jgi:hypothetical protein
MDEMTPEEVLSVANEPVTGVTLKIPVEDGVHGEVGQSQDDDP